MITLDDLLTCTRSDREAIVRRAWPIDPDALAGTTYQGIDLGMPAWFHRWMWRTFRKTFHRDTPGGVVRGWNVRMEQNGLDGPAGPLLDRAGRPRTFGHYTLRPSVDEVFPGGVEVPWVLDYSRAGNARLDPASFGCCPLVAVNEGAMDLLLGWEVFRIGGRWLPLPDHWILRLEGPLTEGVAPPRPA